MDIEDAVRRRLAVCHTQGMAMERQEQRKKARLFSFEPPKYNAGKLPLDSDSSLSCLHRLTSDKRTFFSADRALLPGE